MSNFQFSQRFAGLPEFFHLPVAPRAVPGVRLVAASPAVAACLGLDPTELAAPEHLAWMSGETLPPGARPLASAYAGHQFGVYVPRLGDGRAVLLGDVAGRDGERYEVQLKGVGPTPFARGADGRLGVTAALRELLMGEALAALGIPTARVLAVLAGTEPVLRQGYEPAAVAVRVCPSHVRFGHFEYAHWRDRPDALRALADFVIAHHRPDCAARDEPYAALLERVVLDSARLVALWQAHGFAHGVLNTDNMGVLGHTLDIGPAMFVEAFTPNRPHHHTDTGGRYTFARQAAVVGWNLRALGHAWQPLVPLPAQEALMDRYEGALLEHYGAAMRVRLGLARVEAQDAALVDDLLRLLADSSADYPGFLRALAELDSAEGPACLHGLTADCAALNAWLARYRARLEREATAPAERRAAMLAANPLYLVRAHTAEAAYAAARDGQDGPVRRLLEAVSTPFDAHAEWQDLAAPPPPGQAPPVLSCLT